MEPFLAAERKKRSKKFYAFFALLVLAFMAALVYLINLSSDNTSDTPPVTDTVKSVQSAKVQLSYLATGLGSPTAIASINQPTDHRLFVADRSGIIRIINLDGGVAAEPFLDISS